jgi:hypothetical protein
MALRRSNDVFLLTLVDFLIQVIFFAAFIFVVYQTLIKDPNSKEYDSAEVTKAIQLAGVSDLNELTDELTKLAPVNLKGFNARLGDGGAGQLDRKLERLAKLEQGQGKPACIYETIDGERKPKMLATAIGSASSITFVENTPELQTLLGSLGLRFEDIRSLSLPAFRRTFNSVIQKQPECRYTIILRETTNLVNARDAAQQIFYVAVRR